MPRISYKLFSHLYAFNFYAVTYGYLNTLVTLIPTRRVKGDARQGSHHFGRDKSGGSRFRFAHFQDRTSNTLPEKSGIAALVEDTAVVAIREALAKADSIVEKAIDEQTAAEIDREAAQAKARSTTEPPAVASARPDVPDARPRNARESSAHGRRPSATFARSCIWALVGAWPPRLEMSVIPKKSVPLRT